MGSSQEGAVLLTNTLETNRSTPSAYKNQTLEEVVWSLIAWQKKVESILKAAQDAVVNLERKTAAIENQHTE